MPIHVIIGHIIMRKFNNRIIVGDIGNPNARHVTNDSYFYIVVGYTTTYLPFRSLALGLRRSNIFIRQELQMDRIYLWTLKYEKF